MCFVVIETVITPIHRIGYRTGNKCSQGIPVEFYLSEYSFLRNKTIVVPVYDITDFQLLVLPVRILCQRIIFSFYIFTAIGYLADVSCGKVAAARSPFRFFVFLAFFGHGPSGPIVQYDQQLPCLDAKAAERQVSLDRFCYGIKRFVLGLAKKAIIADQLALIYSRVTSVPAATVPAPALVLGYLAYMMQLYFDFSGYSDMAIGIGSFFGLELPENFNLPSD